MRKLSPLFAAALGVGATVALRSRRQARVREFLNGKRVIVTGGGSGLGLELTRQLISAGARVVICGRKRDPLNLAMEHLGNPDAVAGFPCDVRSPEQVRWFVEDAVRFLGGLDILINNAGVIDVGPASSMCRKDFEECLNVMFWGTYNTIESSLAYLGEDSRIVNVTSVGGVVPLPHLLPYTVAKYAAVGFSEGLSQCGIRTTTVIPFFMRTGSHWNAKFKGDAAREYEWFAVGATMPGVSISVRKAARKILAAVARGRLLCYVDWRARAARVAHSTFETSSLKVLGGVNRGLNRLDRSHAESPAPVTGAEASAGTGWVHRVLTVPGKRAIREHQPRYVS